MHVAHSVFVEAHEVSSVDPLNATSSALGKVLIISNYSCDLSEFLDINVHYMKHTSLLISIQNNFRIAKPKIY